MAAAVADYRPAEPLAGQAAEVAREPGRWSSSRPSTCWRGSGERERNGQVLVGFGAEAGEARARAKAAHADRQEPRSRRLQRRERARHRLRRARQRGHARERSGASAGCAKRPRPRSRPGSSTRSSACSRSVVEAHRDPAAVAHLRRDGRAARREPRARRPRARRHAPVSACSALLAEGHVIIEDFPGVGKTMLAKSLARSLATRLLADPVHARPAPLRRHRRQRLQPARERVRVPARPGLRERPPRRRDQPRLAEDAGGPARGDAGEPGHDRRRDLPARAAVHRARDAEPDRVRGHLSAARGPARPLLDAPLARLSAARGGGADAERADDRAAARVARARRRNRTRSSPRSKRPARSSSRRA